MKKWFIYKSYERGFNIIIFVVFLASFLIGITCAIVSIGLTKTMDKANIISIKGEVQRIEYDEDYSLYLIGDTKEYRLSEQVIREINFDDIKNNIDINDNIEMKITKKSRSFHYILEISKDHDKILSFDNAISVWKNNIFFAKILAVISLTISVLSVVVFFRFKNKLISKKEVTRAKYFDYNYARKELKGIPPFLRYMYVMDKNIWISIMIMYGLTSLVEYLKGTYFLIVALLIFVHILPHILYFLFKKIILRKVKEFYLKKFTVNYDVTHVVYNFIYKYEFCDKYLIIYDICDLDNKIIIPYEEIELVAEPVNRKYCEPFSIWIFSNHFNHLEYNECYTNGNIEITKDSIAFKLDTDTFSLIKKYNIKVNNLEEIINEIT